MGSYLDYTKIRDVIFGKLVTYSWTLPAAAETDTLFTVHTGNVLVTSLFGEVTTLIGSTATTVALGSKPTIASGTEETAGIATATAVTSKEAGCWICVQASSGAAGALVVGGHAGNTAYASTAGTGFPVGPGAIEATTSANAGAGVINWYLTYVPLDTGAYVASGTN